MNDESKLPKWARVELESLRTRIKDLADSLEQVRNAHAVLYEREWTTLPGPIDNYPDDMRKLFILNKDDALQVACLFKGDVLLIGRAKKR